VVPASFAVPWIEANVFSLLQGLVQRSQAPFMSGALTILSIPSTACMSPWKSCFTSRSWSVFDSASSVVGTVGISGYRVSVPTSVKRFPGMESRSISNCPVTKLCV